MPVNVLSGVSGGGGGDPFKEEVAQLRALLAEGGLDGNILEGRYLNQLKRVRQLNVQLEREKTHNKELTMQLAALEKIKEQQNQETGGKCVEGSKRRVRATGSGGAGDESEEQQNTAAVLRERLERAYIQLNESKLQLEEQKKETQRMRKVLQHEIGGTPQELDALLKNVSEGSGGWRGRAQQIVMLKSKVRELERAATAPSEEGGVGVSGDCQRRRVDAASEATGARGTSPSRNMDDVARERVAELQNRRLFHQRELKEALEKKTAEVEVQKRRVEAAQARYVNLEADNHTLRNYLQTLIEKTENDNALIDAYKEELEALQQMLRNAKTKLKEWEAWEKGEPKRGDKGVQQCHVKKNSSSSRCVSANALNTETAIALAGADAAIEINRLKIQNDELRAQLARATSCSAAAAGDSEQSHCDGGDVTSAAHKPRGVDDDTALVVHWLRSVAPCHETATNESCAWQRRVAEVLRKAHGVVCVLEKQRNEDGGRLSKCYETIQHLQERLKKPHVKKQEKEKEEGNCHNKEEFATVNNIILQENYALKQRVKMLHELMEKERLAYESFYLVSPNGPSPSVKERGEENGVNIVEYEKLRRQYEELRLAFNNLQKERFRCSED